ncbi:MAG: hypothetical protein IT442_05050 [Phycisphaeraceae bacterium]|nr:hypothetical protein [Phycisphaeraceae bacterium]
MAPLERAALQRLLIELGRMDEWQRMFTLDLYHRQHHHLTLKQRVKLIELARKYLPAGWERRAASGGVRPSRKSPQTRIGSGAIQQALPWPGGVLTEQAREQP